MDHSITAWIIFCAILGLRALFFCLADMVERFKYIKYSLAFILIMIGIKIFINHYIKIPTYISLTYTIIIFKVTKYMSKKRPLQAGKITAKTKFLKRLDENKENIDPNILTIEKIELNLIHY